MSSIYDFSATAIDGSDVSLSDYRGQVLLVVNVASECGFTPQYTALEQLYRRHRDDGFAVLGFPCDQFGHQEPGDDAEIARFCSTTYDVTFPLFAKVDVNGARAHPLFRWLKQQRSGVLGSQRIKWNFTKFLVGRDGQVVARYGPAQTPESFADEVAALVDGPIGTTTGTTTSRRKREE